MGTDIIIPISRSNRSSFRYSFSFLPKEKRKALHTIYAFCRTTDDIVDNDDDDSKKFLNINKWRVELSKAFDGTSSYQLLNQLVEIANKFNIPTQHFYELIKGVEMDLFNKRYETFQELKDYCYHVASSVGLISIKIFKWRYLFENEENEENFCFTTCIHFPGFLTNLGKTVYQQHSQRHDRVGQTKVCHLPHLGLCTGNELGNRLFHALCLPCQGQYRQ